MTVHCGALPANLLESELFGHEKGSFTGAHERRIGRIEQAQGGTLFLDEIGEIDPVTQVKLLRVLGERTFERVGSGRTMTADIRLVSATNKNLEQMVKAGTFREDLFYRLRVIQIVLPSLRERRGDVPLIARAFLKEFAAENGKTIADFEPAAADAILQYNWPGNVRELRAALEHAVVLCRRDRISLRDLPASVREAVAPAPLSSILEAPPEAAQHLTVQEAEKQLMIRALQECGGNRTIAAKMLGMSRRTLHRKLHVYHLEGF